MKAYFFFLHFSSQKWFDGGFSNSLPIMPTGRTITVSPFSGLQDICPKDKTHADMYIKVANQDMLVRYFVCNSTLLLCEVYGIDDHILQTKSQNLNDVIKSGA